MIRAKIFNAIEKNSSEGIKNYNLFLPVLCTRLNTPANLHSDLYLEANFANVLTFVFMNFHCKMYSHFDADENV